MYHSLTFWDGQSFYTVAEAQNLGDASLAGTVKGLNTWRDWHLIPTEKPSIALPGYETNQFEFPGRSGTIDLTDKIYNGEIIYSNRTGTVEFYIHHDYIDWRNVRKSIVTNLHGKKIKMVLEDDPNYYYEGRFTLKNLLPGESYSTIALDYNLNPYRYRVINSSALGNIFWDPFNFETDYDYTVDPNFDYDDWVAMMKEGVL